MHYELERLSVAGCWLKTRKKYKLLNGAKLQAVVVRDRRCAVRIIRVADDGSREMVEE
jgi:hypothetical protein